jgi:two-component system chemotaxis sensor kinase CheA
MQTRRTAATDRDETGAWVSGGSFDELDEVIGEFLIESHESLDRVDQDLLTLEKRPRAADEIARIFRTVHTIKGTCGFLGFERLERVAHEAENLLGKLRDGKMAATAEIVTALLATGDALRRMLRAIEATGSEGGEDYSELVATLARLHSSAPAAEGTRDERSRAGTLVTRGGSEPPSGAGVSHESGPAVPEDRASAEPQELFEQGDAAHPASPGGEVHARVTDSTIRVDVGLLDGLMNLVGELVLARNQIVQRSATQQDVVLSETSQRLDLITTELQEGIMKTRMQPIGSVWGKLPRQVRDLALECGKRVQIRMEGEDTELDRSLIEAVRDPLTHLVRNAVDHGIERPEVRRAKGKPDEGVLAVRAFHEGGQVNIEITDDGAGIDTAEVRARAVEMGLVPPETAARMGERELLNLIFLPGLSTAENVTTLSGRGVGMDVVRANIERVGGSVDVQSRPGEWTTFKVKIPLTLAIIPALIVETGGERYAIPQVSLRELVRIEAADVSRSIETIQGAPVYRLRGRLLPLVSLARELDGTQAPEPFRPDAVGGGDGHAGAVTIVVLQADDRQFGLLVDGVSDSAEIVVKPLEHHLKGIGTFAGATILGDGKVGLILDVIGLAQRAHVVDTTRDRALIDIAARDQEAKEATTSLLLFQDGTGGRMAIPLERVDRLEEFPTSAIERSGPQDVVQYRDEILPIFDVSTLLLERRRAGRANEVDEADDRGTITVIVQRHADGRVGIVVERILDIVDQVMDLKQASRPGVSGTLVINGRVTEILDLQSLLASALERRALMEELPA